MLILKKEIGRRIFSICFVAFAAFMLVGCMGGGGGGGSSAGGSVGGALTSSLSTSSGEASLLALSSDSGSTVVTVHQPEPSSMILLGSGLLGMLIAKRKKR